MPHPEEQRLTDLLNQHHDWPCVFPFKFIVPADKAEELKKLIPPAEKVETRSSSGGKYTAFTFHCPMGSSKEVLDTYARVRGIPGLISV